MKIDHPCMGCNELAMELTRELIIKCFACGKEIVPHDVRYNSDLRLLRSKEEFVLTKKGRHDG